jgi:hypothetical protein
LNHQHTTNEGELIAMKTTIKVTRDIEKTKNKLIERCKNRGIYENFGQKEVMQLRDKWINISSYTDEMNQIRELINKFDDWCSHYNGQ